MQLAKINRGREKIKASKKAQLSAEMVILLVIIVAIIAIVASNLFSGAKQASSTFENKVAQITSNINSTCMTDFDCQQGEKCVEGKCQSTS
ncbi:MAG: hypothetical protein QXI89_01050 [Candidatus Anstonellales archaeon]